jgi:transcriptional regulator of acetoin/glycerol metabolism
LEDLGLLIRALLPELERIAGGALCLQPEAARLLLAHSWPRNIRELRQCLAAAAVLAESRTIEAAHLPETWLRRDTAPAAVGGTTPDQDLQRELLARLTEQRGNITQVARAMGKARVQVQRWLKRFDIDPAKFR